MIKKDNVEDKIEEPKVAKGFDRDIDYKLIKQKFISEYEMLINKLEELDEEDKKYINHKKLIINKIIYLITAIIQLRNGSRIIEACKSIKLFFDKNNFKDKIIIKIAKSESVKYKKDTKEKYVTKPRFRKIIFPNKWINEIKFIDDIKSHLLNIPIIRLKQRVLDYLLKYFDCNTHSLRYAFINFMLYDQKKEMILVAKMVGHVDVAQLVRYTQTKNIDEYLDMDI